MTAIETDRAVFDAMVAEEAALWRGKGDEYTIGNDRLYNFTSVAEKLGMTPMQVWSVYFLKHVYAVLAYAKSGKEGMEGIEGRLLDIAVYAKLGRLIVRSMKPPIGKLVPRATQLEFDFVAADAEWA